MTNRAAAVRTSAMAVILFVALALLCASLLALPASAAQYQRGGYRSAVAAKPLTKAGLRTQVQPLAGAESDPNRTAIILKGHTDAVTAVPNGSAASLVTKEDVSTPGTPTFHNPARVVFGVKSAAYTQATASIEGVGAAGFALPQSEDPTLLWPGFDTTALSSLKPKSIDFEFTDVSASASDAAIYIWKNGNFGSTEPVLISGNMKLAAGEALRHSSPTHQHVNWLFTAEGTYQIAVTVRVILADGRTIESEPAVYSWAVGDTVIAEAEKASDAAIVGAGTVPETDGEDPQRDESGHNSSENTDGTGNPSGGSAAQSEQCIPTPVKVPFDPSTSAGGTLVGGSYTIPANTHVHPNWVFTAPGTYRVTITQTARMKSGKTASARGTLTFIVGGSGNANSGHFDVGTQASASGIAMVVKDDRSQPASWRSPSQLTFGLSNAAKLSAPAGIDFIAPQGSPIWMISSSQVGGVPWVGGNTMHPSVISHTSGPVMWTLNSVSGPGALAVFESGNFGKAVGRYWFGGLEQAGKGNLPAGVTEENGRYYRTTYVGKTADGKDCQLSQDQIDALLADGKAVGGSLAQTGLKVSDIVTAMALLLLMGGAFIVLRRKAAARNLSVSASAGAYVDSGNLVAVSSGHRSKAAR